MPSRVIDRNEEYGSCTHEICTCMGLVSVTKGWDEDVARLAKSDNGTYHIPVMNARAVLTMISS